jgi:hypothetical protein
VFGIEDSLLVVSDREAKVTNSVVVLLDVSDPEVVCSSSRLHEWNKQWGRGQRSERVI